MVLAIGGMALAIIFSIGVKAGDTGFSLGRRAMTAADADIATSDLRSIFRSIALRPSRTILAGVDRPVSGSALEIDTDVVMERSTQCAPQGWAGRMALKIEPRGSGAVLTCTAAGATRVLIDLAENQAAFSFSIDGQTWAATYTNVLVEETQDEIIRSQSVWIRFTAAPVIDVVESVSSSRPQTWARPDV